jgi:RNA polymerase sigma-70 factor (ECF subfamily)
MNQARQEEYENGAQRLRNNRDGALFSEHRARLFKIAHRMLGSRADAEDVLQDVYLRWHQSATADVQSPLAFLITIATRLCLDRLRSLRLQTCRWIDGWYPASVDEDHIASPEVQLELRDKVSMALRSVLECLGPDERAVFLLHDVFDCDYGEVARFLGKNEPSCRQIVHRARERLREPRPRFAIASESRERVLGMFVAAIEAGDRRSVMALLAQPSHSSR